MAEESVTNLVGVTKRKAKARRYYLRHRDERIAYGKAYYASNTKRCIQNVIAYIVAKKNDTYQPHIIESDEQVREKRRIYNKKRRFFLRNGSVTEEQWIAIVKAYKYRCVYCNKKYEYTLLTIDHLTPWSKGGQHTLWNIAPACNTCNGRKGDRGVLKPVQPLLLILD